ADRHLRSSLLDQRHEPDVIDEVELREIAELRIAQSLLRTEKTQARGALAELLQAGGEKRLVVGANGANVPGGAVEQGDIGVVGAGLGWRLHGGVREPCSKNLSVAVDGQRMSTITGAWSDGVRPSFFLR